MSGQEWLHFQAASVRGKYLFCSSVSAAVERIVFMLVPNSSFREEGEHDLKLDENWTTLHDMFFVHRFHESA